MDSFLIGDNPFTGVSHLSQVAGRERVERLQLQGIMKVMEKAISSGATGYTFSTHPTNLQILKELKEAGTLHSTFDLYPVLPYAEGYVRLANEKGTIGLVKDVLGKLPLSGKAKVLIEGGLAATNFDAIQMLRAYVDMELTSYLSVKPKEGNLRTVLLHEIVTDLALSFEARQLFDSFMKYVGDKYDAKPGFVTRNFARFVSFFRDHDLPLERAVIMTPFNKIGFQMNPSKNACETCLSNLPEGEVIAISIFAGGYLGLDEATDYLRRLHGLSGVAVGVSTEQHAADTFTKLKTLLAG